jgi:class 3 adenylate cyclase
MAALRRERVVNAPETKYTQVGDSYVAYQVVGEGPVDLVFVSGMSSNIDVMWDIPPIRDMLERMAGFSRLILFDRRGAGLSDPVALDALPTWEHWTEDLRVVLDAAGSESAVVMTQADGCHWGMLFAATHPERTTGLILWCPWARFLAADDYPIGVPREVVEVTMNTVAKLWGTKAFIALEGGSRAEDEAWQAWSAKQARASMTPGAAAAQMRYLLDIDVRNVLTSIRVPALVLVQPDNAFVPAAMSRYVAEAIPDARLATIKGRGLQIFGEGLVETLELVEDFLRDVRHAGEPDRVLATVLFTDIVGSTQRASELGDRKWKELLAEHDRVARAQVERFRGRFVSTTGDGLLATFDGPGRAIRCAHTLGRTLRHSGIEIRAGLHTGEIELREGDDIGGIAVHIAARVMAEAGPGEVVCSRTVKDLVAGSEFAFDDRGVCTLRGVPDQWQLFSVSAT